MKNKTNPLNFNQKSRDIFVKSFAKTIKKGAKVLDVGAGTGPYREFFSHCEYKTQDFLQLAQDKLLKGNEYTAIDYVCDVTNIPVENESFDYIICTEVIEHLPEPISALKEISRICMKGGKILITAPLGSHLHQQPYHFYGGYTPYFYNKFLTEFNFQDITIHQNGGFFSFYLQESLRYLKLSISKPIIGILSIPIIPLIGLLLVHILLFRKLFDNVLSTSDYTVGYNVIATKC